jgi:hypothetical protein
MVTQSVKRFFTFKRQKVEVVEDLLDKLGVYLEASNISVTLRKGHVEKGQKEAVVGLQIFVDLETKHQ